MVTLLFFLSGATALIYEVIWSKYLGLMFGSTVHAQTVVLASFMGGLALGNWWLGSRADRLLQPLRMYGILECAIGIFAFSRSTAWARFAAPVLAGSFSCSSSGWSRRSSSLEC